jgi:uncharacterized RDD family membrane protein YckC
VAFPEDASGTMAACPHCNAQILLKMSPEAMAEDGIILPGDDAPIPTKPVFKEASRTSFALDDLVACRECGVVATPAKMTRWGDDEWICFECQPPPAPLAESDPASSPEMKPAGYGVRAVAKVADGLIVGVIVWLVSVMFGGLVGKVAAAAGTLPFLPQSDWVLKAIGALVVAYPAVLLYHTAFVAMKGATPGKMFAELEVVGADGGRPTWGAAAWRFIAETVMAFTLNVFFFQANYIIAAFDTRQRTYHDVLARTRVVRDRRLKKTAYF